jgi:hypothetical protein
MAALQRAITSSNPFGRNWPNTVVTAAAPAILIVSPNLVLSHTQYLDYITEDTATQVISGSLLIATLLKDVSNLIPHAGPLAHVFGATKELLTIVNDMRDNKDRCEHLIERILRFIQSLVEELSRMNVPLQDGTSTAARLYALLM